MNKNRQVPLPRVHVLVEEANTEFLNKYKISDSVHFYEEIKPECERVTYLHVGQWLERL